MAIKYATKTGVWSDTTVWNGGTLPTTGDDVYANAFTVTIDQDITVLTVRTTSNASPVITAGGSYLVSGNRTITITNGINATNHSGGGASTWIMQFTGISGNVTLNADLTGGNATNRWAVTTASGSPYLGTLTFTGSVVGGVGASSAYAMYVNNSDCSFIFNGPILGTAANAVFVGPVNNITIVSNSTVTGGAGGPGVSFTSSNSIGTFNGAVTGGSTTAGPGVTNSGSNTQLIFKHSVTGGAANGAGSAVTASAGFILIDCPMIFGALGATPMWGSGTASLNVKRSNTGIYVRSNSDDNWALGTGAAFNLELVPTGQPAVSDVVAGVKFGASNQFTGTMGAPLPSQVTAGVSVGTTVGTATFALSDVANVVSEQLQAALANIGANQVFLTQTAYNSIIPSPSTLYVITGP